MFDPTKDARADNALRAGLYDLPTPEISADFDARIQAALLRRPSRWQALWTTSRPAFSTAVCTLTGMLVLLHFMQPPVRSLTAASLAAAHPSGQRLPPQVAYRNTFERAPEDAVDNMDLQYASLSFLSHPIHRNTE
jgi:hypothetical protein